MQEENIKKSIFGETLSSLLKSRGVLQEELAVALGVAQANVSKWCNGTIPRGNYAAKIALFFDVPIETLFTGVFPEKGKRRIDSLTDQYKENEISKDVERIKKAHQEFNIAVKKITGELESVSRHLLKVAKTRSVE
ncbi:MAG: helix-turn-helix transcriptional regulator [Kiritimatiellales bacterium]